ncbi:MAG: LysR family transcriptional regulator [Rhodobacteraceae bacterium]|nr:LysR family transcriptional regulator [Paracoccaceae bacterium]
MSIQLQGADHHLLRVFIAIAEEGGLSAAQERLNVAASTVSTHLTHLETRLGLRLCNRGKAGFSLTQEGRLVLEAAYEVQQHMNAFSQAVSLIKGEVVGEIKIGLMANLLSHPESEISVALAKIQEEYPLISLQVLDVRPDRTEASLMRGEFDIVISAMFQSAPEIDRVELFKQPHVVLCSRSHELFDVPDPEISDKDVLRCDWAVETFPLPDSFKFSRPLISTAGASNDETIAHFILAGNHLGYLPIHVAQPLLDQGEVRIIRPNLFGYDVSIVLGVRRDRLDHGPVAACREILLNCHGIDLGQPT